MSEIEIAEDKAIKLSYGALVFILSGIIGFVVWMTTLQLMAQSNNKSIESLESNYSDVNKTLISIDKRLYVIENLLKDKNKKGE